MSASVNADMEAKLKALDCHFTWSIDKTKIRHLVDIPEKLLDRIENYCPLKDHATYYNVLAFLSHLDGNYTSALEYLHKAESALKDRREDTGFLVTYSNFAWVHYYSGNRNQVEAYIEKLENINKGIPKASKIQGSLPSVHAEKGWSLIRLGGYFYREAKTSFEKALEKAPDNDSFNVGYAIVLYRLAKMTKDKREMSVDDQATTQLKKALSMDPGNSELMVLVALQLQNKNKVESMELATKALRLSPDVPHVIRYAAEFFRNEDSINESIHCLGKALEMYPNSHSLHHQIGLCHKQQLTQMFRQKSKGGLIKAKVEACIRHFSRAVELKPSNIHAKVDLAEAYSNHYQMEDAMRIFTSLVNDKSIRDSDKQHCYTSFGLYLFYKKKDEIRAVAQFKNAYQIPISCWDRKHAGMKLKQIAEKWQANKKRSAEASEVLAFLTTEDMKNTGNSKEPKKVLAHSSETDDLSK